MLTAVKLGGLGPANKDALPPPPPPPPLVEEEDEDDDDEVDNRLPT